MRTTKLLFLLLALIAGTTLYAQEYRFNGKPNGFSLNGKSSTTTTIVHNVDAITIENSNRDGLEGQFVTWSGIFTANEAGAPNLPSSSAFVAIPNGATPSLEMVSAKTKVIEGVDLIPAPIPQLDNDDSKAVYEKDMEIYGRNAFYPASPYRLSEVMTVRGVEMVQVGVMPFQYNPVTKELIVYEDMELKLNTEGGDGTYGDLRYRTPEWDQILQDMLLNRDVLPAVDYGERLRKHYENRETGCEYLIITPDNAELFKLADSIKEFRTNQGIPTKVLMVSQCGGNTGTGIRNFIRNAYNNWDMPPAAVLILGDHDTDATKGVVSFTMNNHPGGNGYNPYISDHAYAVMNNNHMPDIIIGRITGRTYDEMYHMIKKDLDYERNPPTNPGFYDHPITAMGFQLERWFQLCSEVVNGFWDHELGKHPVRLNAIYQGTPGSLWSTNENTQTVVNYFGPNGCGYIPSNMSHLHDWNADGNKVNDAINSGAFLIQHRDHGAEEVWGEPSYGLGFIHRLTNKDLTYVMSNNCLTGRFNYGGTEGCFAEVFHRHQYGALGLIAATQVSYSFVNDVYVWGAYDNMWPDFMPTYGTQHATNFIRPAFGNAAGKYFLRQSSWTDSGVKEITYYLFHQHGDAYMTLYSEMPQQLNVEMLPVVRADNDKYQLKVDEDATICLTVNGQIIGFDYGTGNAQQVTITPQAVGTRIKLTITKQNYYRYEHEIAVIPAFGPYLIFHELEVNDPNGNDNQAIDYNETCQLGISLYNAGADAIGLTTAHLSCDNPEVEILQGESAYSGIPVSGTLMGDHPFTVHFGDGFDDGETVRFHIEMETDGYQFLDSVDVTVNAPLLAYANLRLSDMDGTPLNHIQQGTSTLLTVDIQNLGHSTSLEIRNTLEVLAPFISVSEPTLGAESVEAGGSTPVTFRVDVPDNAPTGYIINYRILAESGYHTAVFEHSSSLEYTVEDFETGVLNPRLQWNIGSGNKRWNVVDDESAHSGRSLRSPALGDKKTANCLIAVTNIIDGYFTFCHKTSTKAGDKLIFNLDGVDQQSWTGENDWAESTYELPAGTHLIKFVFSKDDQGSAGSDCVWIDWLRFPAMAELVLYAGDDMELCHEPSVKLNSYAYHYETLTWSTDGDGYFDDETAIQPTYFLGNNDQQSGSITLRMNATASLDHAPQSSAINLKFAEDLGTLALAMPTGLTAIDLSQVQQSTYTGDIHENTSARWILEPEEAGTLDATGNGVTIQWNTQFHGNATLSYALYNNCNESPVSPTLSIRVFNSTNVAETPMGGFTAYPNPANSEVTFKAEQIAIGKVTLQLFDMQGRLVHEAVTVSTDGTLEERLDLGRLSGGLYHVRMTDSNEHQQHLRLHIFK